MKNRQFSKGSRLVNKFICIVFCNSKNRGKDNTIYLEVSGKTREYFWLKELDYAVIVEKRKGYFLLVTAFCVDVRKRADLEHRYR
ncbi:MAG: hypothetical protein Q7J06_12840, partial [Bacteroidales bacterium]|nr:hypothetical protein [Bacteroidales bacterium]